MTKTRATSVWPTATATRVQAVLALAVLAGCIAMTALLVSTPAPARDTGAGKAAASAGRSVSPSTP